MGRPRNKIENCDDLTSIRAAGTVEQVRRRIRAVIHKAPLLVFWVTPEGQVLDAGRAHHLAPPQGDRAVLSDRKYRGHLRGRAAYFAEELCVVVYATRDSTSFSLEPWQAALLLATYEKLLKTIATRNPEISDKMLKTARFIDEVGRILPK